MRCVPRLAFAVFLVACGGPPPRVPTPAPPTEATRVTVPPAPALPRLRARAAQIGAAFGPAEARAVVAYADRFFRVRGNEGYRKTLERVRDTLRDAGLRRVRMMEMGEVRETWTPRAASLTLLGASGDRALIAFDDESEPDRAALLVGSDPLGPTELALIDADAVRAGQDARGKAVVAVGNPRAIFAELVVSAGAAGLLTRNLEPYHQPAQHPDSAQFGYLPEHVTPAFGFSLSAADHAALRQAIEAGPARVRVAVEVATGRGAATAVEARIDGTDPEAGAIVFVAHADEPGANDNGSGVGALTELARALHRLIEDGDVPRPRRTLVFLWGQEMEVSRTWLRQPPLPVAAGLVLDMVGEDPSLGAPFLIERMPDPGAIWLRGDDAHTEWGQGQVSEAMLRGHFLNDLCAAAAAEVASAEGGWRWRTNPFEGGSDHVPFLDRELPAVLGWHFTDDAYHTTRDRMPRVSGDEMRRVAMTLGAVALTLASDAPEDAAEVLALLEHRARARLREVEDDSRARLAEDDAAAATERRVRDAWVAWYEEAYASVEAHYGASDASAAADRWRRDVARAP